MSIFKYTGPLMPGQDDQVMIERAGVQQQILDLIESVNAFPVILGPRQIGKTTLLFALWQRLSAQPKAYTPLYINLESVDPSGSDPFVRLASMINDSLPPNLKNNLGISSRSTDVTDGWLFSIFIDQLSRLTNRLVLMFDEPEKMPVAFAHSIRSIFTRGRETKSQNVVCVLAGGLRLNSYINSADEALSPLSNVVVEARLDDLSQAEVRQLVGYLEKSQHTVDNQCKDHLFALTSGHPYLTQRICAYLEAISKPEIKIADIDDAVSTLFYRSADSHLTHILAQLNLEETRRAIVGDILRRKPVTYNLNLPGINELSLIGVIKHSQDGQAIIRNSVYQEFLKQNLETAHSRVPNEAEQIPNTLSGVSMAGSYDLPGILLIVVLAAAVFFAFGGLALDSNFAKTVGVTLFAVAAILFLGFRLYARQQE